MDNLIGTGIYPLPQAARLVGERAVNVRRWLRGYSWKYRDGRSSSGPLWRTQFSSDELPTPAVGFRDLLELRMVAQFVRHGVHLKVIRATIDKARSHFGHDYPLSNRRFLTDGKRIFLEAVEDATGSEKLIDVAGQQFVFSTVIRPSLYDGIDYDESGAARWFPVRRNRSIVLDPSVQFGTPIVVGVGVPTDALYDAWRAEGRDIAAVSRAYDLAPKLVQAAVGFEQHIRG